MRRGRPHHSGPIGQFPYTFERDRVRAQRVATAAVRGEAQAVARATRDHQQALRVYQGQQRPQTFATAKEQKAYEKEQVRLYREVREAETAWYNAQLAEQVAQLENLLTTAIGVDDYVDLDSLKDQPAIPTFDPRSVGITTGPPDLSLYLPATPSFLQQILPGGKQKHAQAVEAASARHQAALNSYDARFAAAAAAYQRQMDEIQGRTAQQHAEIETYKKDLAAGVPAAIVRYCTLVLETSPYPENFDLRTKVAYVPESKQLVIECDLPDFDIIPTASAYRYVVGKDEIAASARKPTERKALYASIIAQIALRTLHEIIEADRPGHVETVVFNGYLDSINLSTGQAVRPCLITVRTTREIFSKLDLARVDPIQCLKGLNAALSRSPDELVAVRPVLEFNMVDHRFISQTDVLSGLDQRPNLMELTPSEFEALIANLFQKMGLETRLTQASRDGGVDCVAFDTRPIFGGKVVIQAKRYKHTVGVSAVRDLYGTMQNEGASKGILVTTSGYGNAAFEFAQGKPMELLSGSHLLSLLQEHAGLEAKIEVPANWKDPQPDAGPDGGAGQ